MMLKNWLVQIFLRRVKGINLPRDLIRYAVKRNYNKIAVVDGETEISYGELYERAKRLANALLELGLNKGDKAAVLLYNCRQYFEIRTAAYLTGIVLVPLIWDMGIEDVLFILNDCKVKALIYDSEILKEALVDIKQKTRVEQYIAINQNTKDVYYEELIEKAASSEPDIKINCRDIASINFSSGTTGRPKGIVLLNKSWMNSFYNYILNSPKMQAGELIILHILSFATAGSCAFLLALCIGAKNIILTKPDIEEAVSLIQRHGINSLFISPSLFICMIDYCKKRNVSLPLTGIAVGTEAISQEKFKEAIDFFGPIIQVGYGMAEVLPPLSLSCSKDYYEHGKINREKLCFVGKALKGVRFKIIDEKEKVLPKGRKGRIAVKSGSISAEYFNNQQLSRRHYKQDWFYSDDFGYINSEGYLYILGRKQDIIKEKNGEKAFSRQVEEILHQHQDILEACVFLDASKKITACVSLKADVRHVSERELIDFCKKKIDEDIVPNRFVVCSELPKNASGKIDRKRMREEHG